MKRLPRPAFISDTAMSARLIWQLAGVPSELLGQPRTMITSCAALMQAPAAGDAPYGLGGRRPAYVWSIGGTGQSDTGFSPGTRSGSGARSGGGAAWARSGSHERSKVGAAASDIFDAGSAGSACWQAANSKPAITGRITGPEE